MELYYSTYGGLIVIAEVFYFFSVIHMQHMIKIASVLTVSVEES